MIIIIYLSIISFILILLIYAIWRWHRSRAISQFYLCLDGHLVKSRGEWMVDATLQYLGIAHEYEKSLQMYGRTIYPDFSLGHKIYIEYWGLQTKSYLKHKKQKQKLYKRSKYHLINIENEDLKNLLHVLTHRLQKFKNFFPIISQYIKNYKSIKEGKFS
ncbi:MAG: hypothetical protein ACFFD2_02445 [Promethearchaeota archaeon]